MGAGHSAASAAVTIILYGEFTSLSLAFKINILIKRAGECFQGKCLFFFFSPGRRPLSSDSKSADFKEPWDVQGLTVQEEHVLHTARLHFLTVGSGSALRVSGQIAAEPFLTWNPASSNCALLASGLPGHSSARPLPAIPLYPSTLPLSSQS